MNDQKKINVTRLYSKAYLLMSLSNFLMFTGYGFFMVFSLFILGIGGTKSDIGILMGVMPLSAVLSRPWISGLGDRIGRKKSYALGCAIIGTVSFMHLFFQHEIGEVFIGLFVLRLILGVGFAMSIVAGLTFVSDLIPTTRFNEGFGMFGVTGLLGVALGPALAEWVIYQHGFPGMFIAAGLICFLSLAISLPIKELFVFEDDSSNEPFFTVLRHPVLFRVTLIGLLFGIGFAAHGSFVAPYAQSKGLLVSMYFIAYSLSAIVTRIISGRMADRLGEKRIAPVALIITGIGFASLVLVDTATGLWVSGLVTGLGHGMLFPCLISLSIRPMHSQNRGKANGIFTGGVDAGIFCGSITLGFIGEHIGYSRGCIHRRVSFFLGVARRNHLAIGNCLI
jgi:MFS family permease